MGPIRLHAYVVICPDPDSTGQKTHDPIDESHTTQRLDSTYADISDKASGKRKNSRLTSEGLRMSIS